MTFAEWRTLVQSAYQGGEPTQASLLRAVTDGARAVLVRDVESDLQLAKSYRDSARAGMVKMAGTRITTDLAATIVIVKGLMPIDNDTVANLAILENAIEAAFDDVNAMADKWDAYLLQCAIDLQRHVPFFQVRQITTFLEDTAGVTTEGFVSRVALPEGARIQNLTYGHYYALLEPDVELEVDDKVVSNGRVYKVIVGGTLTSYDIGAGLTSTDGDDETLGDLIFQYYRPERDWPVRQMDWSARNRLAAGEFSGGAAYCFPPQSDELWLYPALNEDHRFDLEWVGVVENFEDDDEVLFDRTAAEAAAQFILWKLSQTETGDLRVAAAALAFYQLEVRKCVVDNNDRDTGSPTQVQPYDYRRCCRAWGNCFPPITVNPGSGGMLTNDQITLSNASGTTTIRPTAYNFTAQINFSGDAGDRVVVLSRSGPAGTGPTSIPRGATITVIAKLPEVEGIVIAFRDLIPAGDLLLPTLTFPDQTYTSDGLTTSATFEFFYNGTSWEFTESSIPS
jgi:hypothetical protein